MASKTRKSATAQSDVQVTSSERPERPASPNAATLLSRREEKQNLAQLNDRFATYIDQVRRLQIENQQLTSRIRVTEETSFSERSNLKALYDKEIEDTRRALDDVSQEKSKLVIDVKRLTAANNELNNE